MSEYFDPYADKAGDRREPKKTNCLFWGCLGCFGLILVFSLLVGLVIYFNFDAVKPVIDLGKGAIAQEEGDYEKAIGHYSNAIEQNENFKEAYILRAEAYRQTGDYEKAIADCDKVIALDPKNADIYNVRGLVYDTMGETEKALADFKKSLELGNDDPIIDSNIALTYNDLEDYDNALRYIQQAIDKSPKNLLLIYHRGLIYQNMENHDKALADYETCMKSGKPIVYLDLTVEQSDVEESYVSCLAEMKQYDKVNAYWESKIAKEPANLDNYNSYCYALLDQEEYDKAEKLLDRALAATTDQSEKNELYEDWIDSFCYREDQQERTLALANRYIADTDQSEESLVKLADVYECQDRYEDAIEIYNQLIDLDSEEKVWYHRYRSFCHKSLEQYDKALADFERYGDLLDEKDDYFYGERANIYEKMDRLDEAEEDFNRAIELSGHFQGSVRQERAEFYLRHDKNQLALDDLNHLIGKVDLKDTDFVSGEYWKLRAEVYEKLGEPDKAEADRKQADELNEAFRERWGYSPYDDDETEEE